MTAFKKIADFDVARYMGDRSKLGKCVDNFFRDWFVGHNNAFPNEVMCGAFDWDGETIWTPCGYEHAFNMWSRIGQFLGHVKSDNEVNQETYFVCRCDAANDNGIIFGDNHIILCAMGYKGASIKSIYKTRDDRTFDATHLSVTRDGAAVFTAGQTLHILTRSDEENTEFVKHTILLDTKINWFKLLENRLDSDFSYVAACVAKKSITALDEPSQMMLISLNSKSVINRVEVDGVQDFSRHPEKEEMVVLGQKLTVLSLSDLKTVNSIELPLTGKARDINPEQAVVQYSSNGHYLALAYAANGEVEIRDTKTLEVIHTFSNQGYRLPDLSWDGSGEYLACRFKDQQDQDKVELVVWGVQSRETVFRLSTRNKKADHFPAIAYKWSPHATELACLINNQRIQIYELT